MPSVFRSLKNAFIGLKYCFETQRNMVIHALFGGVVIIAGFVLEVSLSGMVFLLTAIASVLVAEAFNTALERTIDLYTVKRNHIAQTAKDVAAGAVLLASFYAVIVGFIVLGPPLWQLIVSLI